MLHGFKGLLYKGVQRLKENIEAAIKTVVAKMVYTVISVTYSWKFFAFFTVFLAWKSSNKTAFPADLCVRSVILSERSFYPNMGKVSEK